MTAEEKIKEDLLKYIDNMEIDVDSLSSYRYYPHTMSDPSCEDWDEEEEYQAKLEQLIDRIESGDNIGEFIDITDDEAEDEELQLRILNWLKYLKD